MIRQKMDFRLRGNDRRLLKFIFYNSVIFMNSNKRYYFLLFAVSSYIEYAYKAGIQFKNVQLLLNAVFIGMFELTNNFNKCVKNFFFVFYLPDNFFD